MVTATQICVKLRLSQRGPTNPTRTKNDPVAGVRWCGFRYQIQDQKTVPNQGGHWALHSCCSLMLSKSQAATRLLVLTVAFSFGASTQTTLMI